MLIDMHTHYMPKAQMRALERRTTSPRITEIGGKKFIEYGPGSAVPLVPVLHEPDLILEHMDEAGVDHSVLSVTIPGVDWFDSEDAEEVADAANHETAEIAARHPRRMSGLATVPLQDADGAVRVLEKAVDIGLKGVMIYSNVAGDHLDRPVRRRFFDTAAALDMPVMLHPTYPLCAPSMLAHGMLEMAAFLFDTTTAALRLVFDGLYDRHPDFKLVVPHTGSVIPYLVGRIDYIGSARPGAAGQVKGPVSDHIRKFYVDTVCNWPLAVQLCLDFFGPDRIMHGTDHPFFPMAIAKQTLDEMSLSNEVRAKIEHGNAARLFRLQVPASEVG